MVNALIRDSKRSITLLVVFAFLMNQLAAGRQDLRKNFEYALGLWTVEQLFSTGDAVRWEFKNSGGQNIAIVREHLIDFLSQQALIATAGADTSKYFPFGTLVGHATGIGAVSFNLAVVPGPEGSEVYCETIPMGSPLPLLPTDKVAIRWRINSANPAISVKLFKEYKHWRQWFVTDEEFVIASPDEIALLTAARAQRESTNATNPRLLPLLIIERARAESVQLPGFGIFGVPAASWLVLILVFSTIGWLGWALDRILRQLSVRAHDVEHWSAIDPIESNMRARWARVWASTSFYAAWCVILFVPPFVLFKFWHAQLELNLTIIGTSALIGAFTFFVSLHCSFLLDRIRTRLQNEENLKNADQLN
jgi:hypothetical protein